MQYSVIQRTHMGNPVVEILSDGQPWGADRLGPEHFSFGITKARMIRAALPVITQFADSLGGSPWPGQTQPFTDFTGAGVVAVDVTKCDDFEGVGGVQVNRATQVSSSKTAPLRKCKTLTPSLWPCARRSV